MVGILLEFVGHELEQALLDRIHVLARGDPGAVGDAEYMRVHGNRRLTECDVQHDIRRFAPDPGQAFERFACCRHFTAMLVDDEPAGCQDVFCLGAVKADAFDVRLQTGCAELQQLLRRVGLCI